ncbi:hypothetical protein MHO82_20305 [Vibrio sp. Of7-15]|uniref:hypothetical protein n=1 Tax=Vibrio sp. Of7-15 TaxID=2724879 RepID=UPI001EF3156E|nr:hypothetical protein [Vibrio sp. Of7-15]MCG7499212.1 hypothetical protein [Vibrio sp. Of7-15]
MPVDVGQKINQQLKKGPMVPGFVADPIGAELDSLVISKLEQTMIFNNAKMKFSASISQVAAQKIQSALVPKMNFTNSFEPSFKFDANKNELVTRSYMETTKSAYDIATRSKGYRIKKKLVHMIREQKKKPLKILTMPLTLLPYGKLVSNTINAIGGGVDKARRKRKKEQYGHNNIEQLTASLGEEKALRKVAKWQAKDISELGPKIQRNLHKLKHASAMLNQRQSKLELLIERQFSIDSHLQANSSTWERKIETARGELAMSYHEVRHYIDKIQDMSKTMQTTMLDINAHMAYLDAVVEGSEEVIEWSLDY